MNYRNFFLFITVAEIGFHKMSFFCRCPFRPGLRYPSWPGITGQRPDSGCDWCCGGCPVWWGPASYSQCAGGGWYVRAGRFWKGHWNVKTRLKITLWYIFFCHGLSFFHCWYCQWANILGENNVLMKTLVRKHNTYMMLKFSQSCGEASYLTPFLV